MIKSFKNEAARAAWERRFVKGVPHEVLRIGVSRRSRGIAGVSTASGSTISGACFIWDDGDAYAIEIVDYHA